MISTLKKTFIFIALTTIFVILFVFTMFQGGFVSWFLFYSYIPLFLYYICLVIYPIKNWDVDSELSRSIVHAGKNVTVTITIKRKLPFPIAYAVCEQIIPESLHKKDMRHDHDNRSDDASLVYFRRQAKRFIFPWFRRQIRLSFDLTHVPRGEHVFQAIDVRVGDFFGLIKKEHRFPLVDQFVVYPAERRVHLTRQMSNFEEGSVSSYAMNLNHTNIVAGVREYVPGDKFSWIDWKQTARHQEIMTKEFEEEKSVDRMVIFDGSFHDDLNLIAFEGTVELTLALMGAFARDYSRVGLLSVGERAVRFSSDDAAFTRNHIMNHLARVQPGGEHSLTQQLKQEMVKLDQQYIFVFITTSLDDRVKQAIDQLQTNSKKITVLYIPGEASIRREEEANRQYMLKQNVNVSLITESELKSDPIEVTL